MENEPNIEFLKEDVQGQPNQVELDRLYAKEHRLHKVIATSAFVLALCILPVVQYSLITGRMDQSEKTALQNKINGNASTDVREMANQEASPAANSEVGTVAGASTDILDLSTAKTYATKEECLDAKAKDLTDLDNFYNGKKLALTRAYETAIEPYKTAMTVLAGTPEEIASQTTDLQQLIDAEYSPYISKLTDAEKAVQTQKSEVSARTCE